VLALYRARQGLQQGRSTRTEAICSQLKPSFAAMQAEGCRHRRGQYLINVQQDSRLRHGLKCVREQLVFRPAGACLFPHFLPRLGPFGKLRASPVGCHSYAASR